MSDLTSSGIERAGRTVVDIVETERGARIDAAANLEAGELRHVSRLTHELAVNAEKRARASSLPAVVSPAGCC